MYIEGGIYNKFNHNHINSNTNISQIRVNCTRIGFKNIYDYNDRIKNLKICYIVN
jgi:hypothetical protein